MHIKCRLSVEVCIYIYIYLFIYKYIFLFVWNALFFYCFGARLFRDPRIKRGSLIAEVTLCALILGFMYTIFHILHQLPARNGPMSPMVIIITVTGNIKFPSFYNLEKIELILAFSPGFIALPTKKIEFNCSGELKKSSVK